MLVKDFIMKEFPVLNALDTEEYSRASNLLSELFHDELPGSVIVLEVMQRDYSLMDIARIIESNNAHVLGLLTSPNKKTGSLRLIIKIDLEDATPVIRSFERFNYTVRYYYMERGMVDDMLQQRMNELLYYMNI